MIIKDIMAWLLIAGTWFGLIINTAYYVLCEDYLSQRTKIRYEYIFVILLSAVLILFWR